jgi:hypothetical protein
MRLLRVKQDDSWVNLDFDDATSLGITYQNFDIKEPIYFKFKVSNSFSLPASDTNRKILGLLTQTPESNFLYNTGTVEPIYNSPYKNLDFEYYIDNTLITNGLINVDYTENNRLYILLKEDLGIFDLMKEISWSAFEDLFLQYASDEEEHGEKREYYRNFSWIKEGPATIYTEDSHVYWPAYVSPDYNDAFYKFMIRFNWNGNSLYRLIPQAGQLDVSGYDTENPNVVPTYTPATGYICHMTDLNTDLATAETASYGSKFAITFNSFLRFIEWYYKKVKGIEVNFIDSSEYNNWNGNPQPEDFSILNEIGIALMHTHPRMEFGDEDKNFLYNYNGNAVDVNGGIYTGFFKAYFYLSTEHYFSNRNGRTNTELGGIGDAGVSVEKKFKYGDSEYNAGLTVLDYFKSVLQTFGLTIEYNVNNNASSNNFYIKNIITHPSPADTTNYSTLLDDNFIDYLKFTPKLDNYKQHNLIMFKNGFNDSTNLTNNTTFIRYSVLGNRVYSKNENIESGYISINGSKDLSIDDDFVRTYTTDVNASYKLLEIDGWVPLNFYEQFIDDLENTYSHTFMRFWHKNVTKSFNHFLFGRHYYAQPYTPAIYQPSRELASQQKEYVTTNKTLDKVAHILRATLAVKQITSIQTLGSAVFYNNCTLNYRCLAEMPIVYTVKKYITPSEILNLELNKLYFIKHLGGYFYINKISGYNPEKSNEPVTIELIKYTNKLLFEKYQY